MQLQGIFESIFAYFFPFLKIGKLSHCFNAKDFHFNELTSVHLHGFRLTGKSTNQFLLLFVPTNFTIKDLNTLHLSSPELIRQIRNNLTTLGFDLEKMEYINGENKNLSSPPDIYRQEKIIFKYTIKDKYFYLLLPFSFLGALSDLAGLGWMPEISEENLSDKFDSSLFSFERSVLYGKSQLFQNLKHVIFSLEPKFIPTILTDLQSKNLLSYNHIASFHVFYGEEINLPNFLPAEIKKTVLRLSSSIAPLLSYPSIRERWRRQMDYYFLNIFSILFFSSHNKNYSFDSSRAEEISLSINTHRLTMLSKLSSADKMIREIITGGRLNDLIGGEGKELLLVSVAYKEDLPMEELFKMFKDSFREDFRFKVREKEKKIKEYTEAKRTREFMYNKIKFLRFLEDNIIKKFQIGNRSPITIQNVYDLIQSLDENKMTLLYNTLGFELLAALFDALKYLPHSPIESTKMDSFFSERISLLPTVEREITEDIFYEKINQDKLMNLETIEKRFAEVGRRIMAMEQMGYLEKNHD